jgi:hypothetical protein
MAHDAQAWLWVWDGVRAVHVPASLWASVVSAYAGEAWTFEQLDQLDGTSMFVYGEVEAAGRVRWTTLAAAQTRPDLTDREAARRYRDTAWQRGLLAREQTDEGEYVATWADFAAHHGLSSVPGGAEARQALAEQLARL